MFRADFFARGSVFQNGQNAHGNARKTRKIIAVCFSARTEAEIFAAKAHLRRDFVPHGAGKFRRAHISDCREFERIHRRNAVFRKNIIAFRFRINRRAFASRNGDCGYFQTCLFCRRKQSFVPFVQAVKPAEKQRATRVSDFPAVRFCRARFRNARAAQTSAVFEHDFRFA